MLKNMNGSGLSAAPGDLIPPTGYKWTMISAVIVITSSATAGTRRVYFYANRNNLVGLGELLCDTAASTAVSSTIVGLMEAYGSFGSLPATNLNVAQFTPYPVLTEFDHVTWGVTLIAGDVFNYYIIVQEELA